MSCKLGAGVLCSMLMSAPALAEEAAQPEEKKKAWYDKFQWSAMVDAYLSVGLTESTPLAGGNTYRAYDTANGFALNWFGLNIAYPAEPVGATLSLLMGPGAAQFNSALDTSSMPVLTPIRQAFVTWAPSDSLTFDFGKFDTIFGAEVAANQANHNYTRGALNWLEQPFYHSGLRIGYALTDSFSLTGLIVNGWNNTIDDNAGKSFGLQASMSGEGWSAFAGYLGGPEGAGDWRHFVDAVLSLEIDALSILFNGNLTMDDAGAATTTSYGFMASARYLVGEQFAFAVRGEFIGDPDGWAMGAGDATLVTGTLTLDFMPAEGFMLRLDGRGDFNSASVYDKGNGETTDKQITVTLGVVYYVD